MAISLEFEPKLVFSKAPTLVAFLIWFVSRCWPSELVLSEVTADDKRRWSFLRSKPYFRQPVYRLLTAVLINRSASQLQILSNIFAVRNSQQTQKLRGKCRYLHFIILNYLEDIIRARNDVTFT